MLSEDQPSMYSGPEPSLLIPLGQIQRRCCDLYQPLLVPFHEDILVNYLYSKALNQAVPHYVGVARRGAV